MKTFADGPSKLGERSGANGHREPLQAKKNKAQEKQKLRQPSVLLVCQRILSIASGGRRLAEGPAKRGRRSEETERKKTWNRQKTGRENCGRTAGKLPEETVPRNELRLLGNRKTSSVHVSESPLAAFSTDFHFSAKFFN